MGVGLETEAERRVHVETSVGPATDLFSRALGSLSAPSNSVLGSAAGSSAMSGSLLDLAEDGCE